MSTAPAAAASIEFAYSRYDRPPNRPTDRLPRGSTVDMTRHFVPPPYICTLIRARVMYNFIRHIGSHKTLNNYREKEREKHKQTSHSQHSHIFAET